MEFDKNNQPEEEEELTPLDPKSRVVSKTFRKFKGSKPEVKKKKRYFSEFPQKAKDILHRTKVFTYTNISKIIVVILLILVIKVAIFIFVPTPPTASFIDKNSEDYIYGYVYLDDNLIGDTDGLKFNDFPKEYCDGAHTIKLESITSSFEWQTYPIDCRSKNIIFYVEHDKAQPSGNLIFKFMDKTGSFYIAGKLYFDDIFIQDVNRPIAIERTKCKNITKIRLEYDNLYDEWDNNIKYCDILGEIKYKIS